MHPYEGDKPYIFVSYSHKDAERVLPVIDRLLEAGFRVWYDAGITFGEEWLVSVAEHLVNSHAVLTFISRDFESSQHCSRELTMAINHKKILLTVFLDEFKLSPGLEYQIANVQVLTYSRYRADAFFDELLRVKGIDLCRQPPVLMPLTVKAPKDAAYPEEFDVKDGVLVKYKGKAREVFVPNGITAIGKRAFSGCQQLQSVTLPDSITMLDAYAFYRCTSLSHVTLSQALTSIGYEAFGNCTSLASIVLPDSCLEIDNAAFSCCSALESVTVPDGVRTLGGKAFADCISLTRVKLPSSITEIREDVFRGCVKLSSVSIPDGITAIGEKAFYFCNSLSDVHLPESLQRIAPEAFQWCLSLDTVRLPHAVSVAPGAFSPNTALLFSES